MSNMMFSGFICCYQSCNFEKIVCCCKGSAELLCLTNDHCCALNEKPFPIGMATESDECCKIALFCCQCGLKVPSVLCSGASQLLCIQEAQSFPFDSDYVGQPVCAMYCLQCAPNCGCCQPPPPCPALERLSANATPTGELMKR